MKRMIGLFTVVGLGISASIGQPVLDVMARFSVGGYYGALQPPTGVSHPLNIKFLNCPFAIDDPNANKTIWLNERFEVIGETPIGWVRGGARWDSTPWRMVTSFKDIHYIVGGGYIWNMNGSIYAVYDELLKFKVNGTRPIVFNGMVFGSDGSDDGDFHAFTIPEKAGDQYRLLSSEPARALFAPDSGWEHKGLTIDSKNRLFLNGEIYTRDFQVFTKYLLEKYGEIKIAPTARGSKFNPSVYSYTDDYLGRDMLGNWYWDAYCISPTGVLLHDWTLEVLGENAPAEIKGGNIIGTGIEPSGDIYYLMDKGSEVLLVREQNTWAPKARTLYAAARAKGEYKPIGIPDGAKSVSIGTINDNNVRLRSALGTDAKSMIIGKANNGDKVQVLARSWTKDKIGNMEAYWYIVQLADGKRGWMYGFFVDVADPESLDIDDYGRGADTFGS